MNRLQSSFAKLALAGSLMLSPAVSLAQSSTPGATPIASPVVSAVACPSEGLHVIGMQILPTDLTVDDTQVGGLSGIDYDPANDAWYLLSDDRSDLAPARFYNATLDYSASSFNSVSVDSAVTLLQEDGEPYPNQEQGGNVPDPEAIRVDPQDASVLWWTSEGSYDLDIDPFVASVTTGGEFVGQPALPERYQMQGGEELGPRNNMVFEGLTFDVDGESLWLLMEGPMYQDAAIATVDAGTTSRIANIDREGNVIAEYAYEQEPLPADPGELFGTTGLTEILAVDDTRFLVIERATVQNEAEEFINYIDVYLIDTSVATDVAGEDSLADVDYTPVSKTLVFSMNDCGMDPIDNMEGLAWGPELENGSRSLVMVSDNNFNDTQVQQFLVFEVTGF